MRKYLIAKVENFFNTNWRSFMVYFVTLGDSVIHRWTFFGYFVPMIPTIADTTKYTYIRALVVTRLYIRNNRETRDNTTEINFIFPPIFNILEVILWDICIFFIGPFNYSLIVIHKNMLDLPLIVPSEQIQFPINNSNNLVFHIYQSVFMKNLPWRS